MTWCQTSLLDIQHMPHWFYYFTAIEEALSLFHWHRDLLVVDLCPVFWLADWDKGWIVSRKTTARNKWSINSPPDWDSGCWRVISTSLKAVEKVMPRGRTHHSLLVFCQCQILHAENKHYFNLVSFSHIPFMKKQIFLQQITLAIMTRAEMPIWFLMPALKRCDWFCHWVTCLVCGQFPQL